MHEHRTLLGFDFGVRRIGVAVGQWVTQTASPLVTIRNQNNRPDWIAIKRLIEDWHPDALVVGVPLSLAGEAQEMTYVSEKFMRQLNGRFHLPIYGIDERLSSFEAAARTGGTVDLDATAAQIIMETWFVEHHAQVTGSVRCLPDD